MIYRFNVFLAKPFFKHFSLISKTLAIENSFNTLSLRSSWSFILFVYWQPCNHFNVTFKVLPTNVTNVIFPFSTTKLKHVSFVSFFPNKSFNIFVKPFWPLLPFLKWFSFHFWSIRLRQRFLHFLKVRHESFFMI